MNPVTFVGLVIIAWEALRGRRASPLVERLRGWRPAPVLTWATLAASVIAFAVQLGTLVVQAHADPTLVPWAGSLPFILAFDHPKYPAVHALFGDFGFLLALVQTGCLVVVVAGFEVFERPGRRIYLWLAVGAMALLAAAAPAISTIDVYEYVQCAVLGLQAYSPLPHTLPPAYDFIARNVPVRGLIYGPLWLGADMLVTSLANSIAAKIEALRIFNALVLLATAWLLVYAGLPRRTVAAFALNPALWFYYVSNAHFDMQALALVVAAYGLSRRQKTFGAALCLTLAGLVKIPFVVIGGLVLASLQPLRRRVLVWFAIAAAVVAVSYAFGGKAYFAELLGYSGYRASHMRVNLRIASEVLFGVVLLITAAGALRRRWFVGAAWVFPALSPLPLAWYMPWGIPYALAAGRGLTALLVTLPLATVAYDDVTDGLTASFVLAAGLAGIFALDVRLAYVTPQCPAGDPALAEADEIKCASRKEGHAHSPARRISTEF
ncbi:MAG: hypothetical protein ACLPYS_12700 [Vulcanimicrobiaceae bacterium]